MSAASPIRPSTQQNSKTYETIQTVNLLAKTQRGLTASELRMALILLARGAHREDVCVTAKEWRDCTGLDPKSRDLAIRGLQKKGLSVSGRGDRASFRFSTHDWREYISRVDHAERPHVEQKRAPAKPGQMIHPECREQGCFLARQVESNLISIDTGAHGHSAALVTPATMSDTPTNQDNGDGKHSDQFAIVSELGIDDSPGRVAEHSVKSPTVAGRGSVTSAANSRAINNEKTENDPCVQNQDSKTISTLTTTTMKKTKVMSVPSAEQPKMRNTTQIAPNPTTTISKSSTNQTRKENRGLEKIPLITEGVIGGHRMPVLADQWPLTLTAMAQRFLTAGVDFLARLVALVHSQFADVNDSELAQAIGAATKRDQKSEALWLRTVPACIANVRRERAKSESEIARRNKQAEEEYQRMMADETGR